MNKLLSAAAILSAFAAVPANAACSQVDLFGNWSTNTITTTLGVITITHCGLVINPAGIIGTTSTCLLSTGGKTTVKGSLHLAQASACRYNGTLTFANNNSTVTIDVATMSQNKQIVEGAGKNGIVANAGGGVVFNMVKVN